MRKVLSKLILSVGVPALFGLGLFAMSAVVTPSDAEAGCYTSRSRYCYYSYGRRICRYRTYRRCTRSRRCYYRRRRVRRRYCYTRYRYGSSYRYCSYRTYWRRYRVCY